VPEAQPFAVAAGSWPSAADMRRFSDAERWVESFIRPITGLAPQKTLSDWLREGPVRLARMDALLARLGHPERSFTAMHVTGTSGKGSVCAYLGAVLSAAGIKVGVHSSPYLQTSVEKLQIDGRYANPAQFADLVDAFRAQVEQGAETTHDLPYPAIWVALTYLHFARSHVRFGVIEASAGGRYDWTNTLRPSVAVVTTVGPDHLQTLGPGLAEIAFHKAGVIKAGVPVVTGVRLPERRIVDEEATRQGSRLLRLGVEFDFRVQRCGLDGTTFDFFGSQGDVRGLSALRTGLLGRHQAFNAALAVAALQASDADSRITEDALRTGLRAARLPGRMELVQRDPVVVLDGAHNGEKAAALALSIAEIFPGRRLWLVVGSLSSKDATGILQPFRQQTHRVVVTVPQVLGKAGADPERTAATARAFGMVTQVEAEPVAAVRIALAQAGPDDLICVTGSLYLVGAVRRLWVSNETVLATGYSVPPAGL